MSKRITKYLITLLPLMSLILGGCQHNNPSSSSTSSSGDSSSTTSQEGLETIDIWAVNDFHGSVEESYGRMGLVKWGSFLNEKGKNINTLLLDQGDSWQGSIYSNYNHGAMITDVMNYIHFDARSVGNHDFDWGTEYLASNTAKEYEGYSTPVLAGNVYDYNFDTKTVGTVQQSELGRKSVTYTLENGLKVGILGGIGKDQITSICSLYTTDICFTDHIDFIKSEATHLRNDEKCDVVIASIHTGQGSVMGYGLESYVDLVLCGHTHSEESANEGKLYFSQNEAYGQSLGHITLTYDRAKKDVINTNIQCLSAEEVKAQTTVDPTIQGIVNTYNTQCEEAANQVLVKDVTGNFYSTGAMPNLMCKAIYDQAVKEGHDDVLVACVNQARASKYSGSWTYADLYEAFPFDNTVFIADVTASEFRSSVKGSNYIYRSSSFTDTSLDDNKTYRIAIIDYVYYHTNSNRYYDKFPTTGGTSKISLSKNYREILRDWFINNNYNTTGTLDSSNFSSSLWEFNRSQLPS